MVTLTLNGIRYLALGIALALAVPVRAADVSVQLDAGSGFSVLNNPGAIERLRVDEATGNVSRNGALFVHTTGTENLFVGVNTGNLTTTGFGYNVVFGSNALVNNTVGVGNSAFGARVLRYNTIGGANSAFGFEALKSNTDGQHNSAFGVSALTSNTTGIRNVAFGSFGMRFNSTGIHNTALGYSALTANTAGQILTAVGAFTLDANTTGVRNSAFGSEALGANTTGNDNLAVGWLAGGNQTTGSNNIYLANQGVAAETGQIKIGTVGTHTQATVAGIHGRTSTTGIAVLVNASGTLGTSTSSARFKQDVRDMGEASDVLMRLRPVTFRYREDAVGVEEAKTQQYGLIAEEVAKVAPGLVAADLEGRPYSVKYHELPALLLNEVQDQRRTIATLESRIAELEGRTREETRR